jgi:hypothetical protein
LQFHAQLSAGQDSLVHGSARPGAKGQRCFNEADKVTEQEGGLSFLSSSSSTKKDSNQLCASYCCLRVPDMSDSSPKLLEPVQACAVALHILVLMSDAG